MALLDQYTWAIVMINIKCKENVGEGTYSVRYKFLCPFCNEDIVFFYNSPRVCRTCFEDLPEIGELFRSEVFKRRWHRGVSAIRRVTKA
jgi:hypothetical protein